MFLTFLRERITSIYDSREKKKRKKKRSDCYRAVTNAIKQALIVRANIIVKL